MIAKLNLRAASFLFRTGTQREAKLTLWSVHRKQGPGHGIYTPWGLQMFQNELQSHSSDIVVS
jgi:hypothetical protein